MQLAWLSYIAIYLIFMYFTINSSHVMHSSHCMGAIIASYNVWLILLQIAIAISIHIDSNYWLAMEVW